MTNKHRITELEYMMLAVMTNLGVLIDKFYGVSEVSDYAFETGCVKMKEMILELADSLKESQ